MTTSPKQLILGLLPEPAPVNLRDYDLILINTSAGKDSQAMLDHVVALAKEAGVMDRLVAVHCDLGPVEWQGARSLSRKSRIALGSSWGAQALGAPRYPVLSSVIGHSHMLVRLIMQLAQG
jgi:hypothetical protein